jgi:transposase
MNDTPPSDFAAFIGIDWADRKHDVCVQAAGANKPQHRVIAHTPEAIDAWACELRERFGGKPIAVCLELTKGPLVSALQRYDFFVLFPINPRTLAKYRQSWSPSGKKDDHGDALLILDVLLKHPDRLKALRPQSAQMRALQQLVEDRRKLVHDRVRVTNRISAALKAYFPQPLDWFEDKGTAIFCDFLERWPTAELARSARRATLESFFHSHNVRYAQRIEQRITAIKQAVALTDDIGVVLAAKLRVVTLVSELRVLISAIAHYDAQIARLCDRLADYKIFASLPGAAEVFAPRLLAAFGEDRQRFGSAAELQRYAGLAPVTEASGNSRWVHWRWACTSFVRQSFVEWVAQTIPRSFWAGAFYQQQKAKGASHQAALRALAFKWARILYRCWVERTPYDESRYLKALQKRRSSLLTSAATAATPA